MGPIQFRDICNHVYSATAGLVMQGKGAAGSIGNSAIKKVSAHMLADEQWPYHRGRQRGHISSPSSRRTSPRWNPMQRCFIGLTLEKTKADMLRSVLEGVALNLNLCLLPMKQQTQMTEMRILGGGAKGAQWRQILADVYDMPILVPRYLEEATSMGAAVIGGVGSGLLDSFDRVDSFIEFVDRVEPNSQHVDHYKKMAPLV